MKGIELTDIEIIELLKSRFLTTRQAADLIGFEFTSAVNTLVKRDQIEYHRISKRLILIPIVAAERYRDTRPGKGGRPKKD